MWPHHSFNSYCILQCDHCKQREETMFHTLLDPADSDIPMCMTYNTRGWILCEHCSINAAPKLRKKVFDYVRAIRDRKNSKILYQYHCLPFPIDGNTTFRVESGEKDEFVKLTPCAYYDSELEWHILATHVGGKRETYRVLPVKEWEKLNPHLVSDATRFFTSGSMFREEDSRWLDV